MRFHFTLFPTIPFLLTLLPPSVVLALLRSHNIRHLSAEVQIRRHHGSEHPPPSHLLCTLHVQCMSLRFNQRVAPRPLLFFVLPRRPQNFIAAHSYELDRMKVISQNLTPESALNLISMPIAVQPPLQNSRYYTNQM